MASPGTWQVFTYDGMEYQLLLPDGYSPNEQYPLLLFEHGGGEEANIPNMINPWFNTAAFRAAYPAIVIAPILPGSSLSATWGAYPADGTTNSVGENQVLAIVQHVLATYPADPSRVYVTGLSLGGHGSWDLMIKYNGYNGPDGRIFAAGLPLAGAVQSTGFDKSPSAAVLAELSTVPIWAINGNDGAQGWSVAVAAALGTNGAFHYTDLSLYLGHDVWDTSYPLPTGAQYYNWMFSQEASALVTPPVISGTGGVATSDLTAVAPFSLVAVSNISIGGPATATVTLSAPADGTLGNLGSGSYNALTGVYTVTGDATAISAALDALLFIPTAHQVGPGQTVTTAFTLQVTDSDGAVGTNSSARVTATGSPFGPATVTGTGGATLSVPFESYPVFVLVQPLLTSISAMVTGGSVLPALATSPPTVPAGHSGLLQIDNAGQVAMPVGYQFAIDDASGAVTVLGGASDGQLVVAGEAGLTFSAGTGTGSVVAGGGNNLVLVGSGEGDQFIALGNGADTINVVGGNNSIQGGNGNNLVFFGAGQSTVNTSGADTLVSGSGTGFVTANGGQSLVFGNFTSSAGALNAFLGGARATISAANSATSVTTHGANGLVYGSFGAMTGGLSETDTGLATTVYAGNFGATMTLDGSNALAYGDFTNTPGVLRVLDGGSGDTISAANSAMNATLSGSQALLFGGYGSIAGALNVVDTGHADTIAVGNSNANITAGGGSVLLAFGGTAAFHFVGGSGTATVVAGSGASTISGGSGGSELIGGSGSAVISGGSGNDILLPGSGQETLSGGGGSDIFSFIASLTHGSSDGIADFGASDTVYLTGYGANDAATALNGASSANGNTTLTLADNTRITFVDVASAAALQGHMYLVPEAIRLPFPAS